MKKYYAKELRSGNFDYEIYFSDDYAEDMNMWIGGNRDFIEMNKPLYKDIDRALKYIYIDCENIKYDNDGEISAEEKRDLVEYYFRDYKKGFTENNVESIVDIAYEYDTEGIDNTECIVEVLSIVYGVPFKSGTMSGSVQREWVEYICPASVDQETIDYIEGVFFGTGTEYLITEEKIDSAKDFDDVESVSYFTVKYRTEDIKRDLAKQFGCEADELVILNIKEEHHYTTYDYEEA